MYLPGPHSLPCMIPGAMPWETSHSLGVLGQVIRCWPEFESPVLPPLSPPSPSLGSTHLGDVGLCPLALTVTLRLVGQ